MMWDFWMHPVHRTVRRDGRSLRPRWIGTSEPRHSWLLSKDHSTLPLRALKENPGGHFRNLAALADMAMHQFST